MKPVCFSVVRPSGAGRVSVMLLAGVALLGTVFCSQPLLASPPSKIERGVSRGLEKASSKVGDFFFKIARKLEQAGFTDQPEPRYFDERPSVRVEVQREEYGDHRTEYIDPDTGLSLPPGYPQGYTVRPLPPGRSTDGRRVPPRYEERGDRGFVPPDFQENPQPRLTYPRQSVTPAPAPNSRSRLSLPVNPQADQPEPREVQPRVANPSLERPAAPQERQAKSTGDQSRSDDAAASPPAPKAPSTPASESLPFATPVPGKRGFVYPPGVEHDMKNMLDVRDFTPGQKVRDPRTGEIFLVPGK